MKALCKLKAEPGIWMTDIPIPDIGVNDVLVKIKKTAICGTDIHIYHWDEWAKATIPVPMAVGHEFMGEIVALGNEVAGLKIGDRVSGEGHITCGHCRRCRAGEQHLCRNTIGIGVNRQGCFAEYLAIPGSNIFKLPEEISDEVGSILDPLGNATHTALSFDMVGEDVLITGAGPIGIMAVAIAKKIGCRNVVISDVNDYRLDLAKKMGADRVVNVMRESIVDVMPELNIKEGYDVALEMSGNPRALNDLLRSINHGGQIAMLGIQPQDTAINWDQVIFKGLTIKGIYGREMYETWYKMSSLIQAGLDVTPVITHRFPIDEFQKGFEVMAGGEAGKVILNWDIN
jgi:threonine 3-dehydrogenase